MIRHPLDDEFDMPVDPDDDLLGFVEVHIPLDPKLDTIVSLAMQAYKQQMDDVVHIEPKNRLKFYEVAERFLSNAKDAMYKIEQIQLQRDKMMNAIQKKGSTKEVAVGTSDTGETVDRKSLHEKVKAMRVVK